jgi:zinc protease
VPPLYDPASVVRHTLANGLRVLVRRDDSAPVVAINTYVDAGYFDEPDPVVGVAHVLEHMFFKGTARRGVGEIAKQTKAEGGYLNAHTIYDHTSYYAVLPASGFAEGLDIQADAYAGSVVDAAELAKELEVIIQEAKRKLDNPSAVTVESLYALLHDRHRIRRWRIGTEEGLRRLTRDDVVGFYRTYYRPSNTVLAVVGDVDVADALARVERHYGALADGPDGTAAAPPRDRGPAEPPRPDAGGPPRYQELDGDVRQAQLAFGWRTPGTADPDTPRLDLAAAVLATGRASRLYRAVRERSLASSVSAYNSTPTELGVFVAHFEGDAGRAAEAARAVWGEVAALRDGGAREDELERVRRIVAARAVRRLETMEGQASWLAEWESHGDWQLGERYHEALLAATADEVTDAARRWLAPGAAAAVAYRPRDAAPLAADAAAFARLLDGAAGGAEPPAGDPTVQAPAVRAGRPRAERVEAGVHVFRTAGGVPVLVVPKPGARIVHLGATVLGGAVAEPDEALGITALAAAASVKGTATRTAAEIAEAAERMGGSVGASAGFETFGWGISVPTAELGGAAALLADVVQHASFPDDAVETERLVAAQQLRTLRDDMYRWPMRLAGEAAYAGHVYGRPVGGTEATLAALTPERVRAWHRQVTREAASVLALVGDVDPAEAASVLDAAFGELAHGAAPAVARPAWPEGVVVRDDRRAKRQTALAILFSGPTRRDPERVVAQLLAGVASGLGGRFFDELRDRRSLAYTVHAFAPARRCAGAFGAYIATGPEQEEEARAGLLHEFARLAEGGVTEDELRRAQTYALGTHAIARQSGGAVLGDAVDAWLLGEGLGELDAYEARVRGVTTAAVQALAARHFDPARRVEGVVRGTAAEPAAVPAAHAAAPAAGPTPSAPNVNEAPVRP